MFNSYSGKKSNPYYFSTGDKLFIAIFFSISFLSGCTQYQYLSVNSYLQQNEKMEYTVENDTVLLNFSFSGESMPITVTIYNKLHQPVYIDLARSTAIINDFQNENPFDIEGQTSFIAPLSYATIKSNPLVTKFFKLNPRDSLQKVTIITNVGKSYSFSETTTPVFFRCILAITTNEDYSNPTFFDYSFWISDILQTYEGPKSSSYTLSNQSHLKKTTAFGKSAFWIGTIGLLVVLLIATGGGEVN